MTSSKNQNQNLGDNPYTASYQDEAVSLLEQNAPKLRTPSKRGINKKIIAFSMMTALLLAGVAVFAVSQFSPNEPPPVPERGDTVSVPDFPPFPTASASAPASEPDNGIAASSMPALPPVRQEIAEVETLSTPPPPVYMETPAPEPLPPPPMPYIPPTSPHPENTSEKEEAPLVQINTAAEARTANARVGHLPNPDKLLVKGTYLRCVLETKIITDVAGMTSCVITEPVYSYNGRHLLIPKGSRVSGQYAASSPVTPKLTVIWERLVTPSGTYINLNSPGVDGLGSSGHTGHLQTHWRARLTSAVMISLIADALKYAAVEYAPAEGTTVTPTATVTNPFESETVQTIKQVAVEQLQRHGARPNTLTINQGSLINIYTAQDIDFSSISP